MEGDGLPFPLCLSLPVSFGPPLPPLEILLPTAFEETFFVAAALPAAPVTLEGAILVVDGFPTFAATPFGVAGFGVVPLGTAGGGGCSARGAATPGVAALGDFGAFPGGGVGFSVPPPLLPPPPPGPPSTAFLPASLCFSAFPFFPTDRAEAGRDPGRNLAVPLPVPGSVSVPRAVGVEGLDDDLAGGR